MSQFWHNICCREPCVLPCELCPDIDRINVKWTGSLTYEALCCEDPVNYPDYPCFPHDQCTLWGMDAKTIGPIDFVLEAQPGGTERGDCYWKASECFAFVGERCIICDCPREDFPQPDPITIWVCVTLELFCTGGVNGVWNALLSFRLSTVECTCTGASSWSISFVQPGTPRPCTEECPEFPCDDEWDPYIQNGDPGPAYGGGTNNCNRWNGTLPPAVATYDPGTLLWKSAC